MKQSEKKFLKGDEFVSGLRRVLDFLKSNEKNLFIAIGCVAVVILIVLGLFALDRNRVRKESQTVGEIIALRADLDKNPANLSRLEKLAGDGRFSRLAYVELASYWMEKGDLNKAEQQASRVKPKIKDTLYYQAQDLLARIAVRKKDFAKALGIYKTMEEEKPKDYPLDGILFHKAEALEQKGDIPGAIAVYKKIQAEFNQTYFGYEAALKASKLATSR